MGTRDGISARIDVLTRVENAEAKRLAEQSSFNDDGTLTILKA
jgi:hypothetical protein